MKSIEIKDTNNEFSIRIGNHILTGENIVDYKIIRDTGKIGKKIVVTFETDDLKIDLDLKNKKANQTDDLLN